MANINRLRDGTFEVEGRIFNREIEAYSYLRYRRDREAYDSIQQAYREQMLDNWGNPYSQGVSVGTSDSISSSRTSTSSDGTSIDNTNISTIRRNRGQNIVRRVEEEIGEANGELRTDLKPELARELQRAKNLQKGLDDWGDVYSQSSDRWYQKEVEEKKAAAEKELKKMKARLAKQGVYLTDELPTFVPQETQVKPKANNSRKIFILDEE